MLTYISVFLYFDLILQAWLQRCRSVFRRQQRFNRINSINRRTPPPLEMMPLQKWFTTLGLGGLIEGFDGPFYSSELSLMQKVIVSTKQKCMKTKII